MQEFATALVDRYGPADANPDPTKTLDRLSAVLHMHRGQLGQRRAGLLDALFNYWRAAVDLVQRQEHGGQKEGEVVVWVATAVIGLGALDHCLATTVNVVVAAFDGTVTFGRLLAFLGTATPGNVVGGVVIVSVLSYGRARGGLGAGNR